MKVTSQSRPAPATPPPALVELIHEALGAMQAAGLPFEDLQPNSGWKRHPKADHYWCITDAGVGRTGRPWLQVSAGDARVTGGVDEATFTWCSWTQGREHVDPLELQEIQQQLAEAAQARKAERERERAAAAAQAQETWARAATDVNGAPYLQAKGVRAHGIRRLAGTLLVPVADAQGTLHGLQSIGPDGSKRFNPGAAVAGHYHLLGTPARTIYVAEGYATAATIHEVTGEAVACAFNAGNLKLVAEALRQARPGVELVISGDEDTWTEGNPGRSKATAAAGAVGARLVFPTFRDTTGRPTDFNDLARLEGLEEVRRQLAGGQRVEAADPWPEPQELTSKIDPEPYPVDALPMTIRRAVEEVQGFTKAPVPLVASSALSALSVACQGHIDVKRAEKLLGPVALFMLGIADSGERKTTCDSFFTSAIRQHQDEQAVLAEPEMERYRADLAAWNAQKEGVQAAIKAAAKQGRDVGKLKDDLRKLEAAKPKAPLVPRMLLGDETPENLAWSLASIWPAAGVLSSEAGIIFGAHGMGKESVLRNLALLNVLWDGGTHSVGRRTSESFTVRGARLTVGLQVQEAALRSFFDKSGGLARGTGFLARFLVSWPESTQGFRPFTEAPASWPSLSAYHQRITAILARTMPINEDGVLTPALIGLQDDTKRAWVKFHDTIESELRNGGELYDVRDVASKSADNAVRLAALFHLFEGGDGPVGLAAFDGASRIAAWHLHEARRFFGELALPEELADATRLDGWLIDYCRRERAHMVPTRAARQFGPVRDGRRLDRALEDLAELDRVRVAREGKRRLIYVNPALVEVTP